MQAIPANADTMSALADRRGGAGVEVGGRADDAQQADDRDGEDRREGRRGDGQQRRLEHGHHDQVDGTGATRAQESELGPTPLDEHPGHEDDRVPGENRELDREQDHPAAADEHGATDVIEQSRE